MFNIYRSDRNEMPSVRGGVTNGNPPGAPPPSSIKQSYLRVGEDCMVYR